MDRTSIDDARRIFGSDVVGWEEVSSALAAASPAEEDRATIDRLPFSREQLMRAADEAMMLVLRLARVGGGPPLTILELASRFPGRGTDGEPWFSKQPFATAETCTLGWALVEKQPFPQSRNLSYDEQTEELERRSRRLGLRLRRRTAVEAVYDTLLYSSARGERLLGTEWDWSSTATSDGGFVSVGNFDDRGLRLLAYSKAVRFSTLGLCGTVDAASAAEGAPR
jgi:hypothetical protein